jgi:hypothetical protein
MSSELIIDRKIILKRMLAKYGAKMWTGFKWLRIVTDYGLHLGL